MIGRSLGQTIEVLGQEWRFKGQAGGSSSIESSTNLFLVTKRGWGKAGWGSLRRQVQTWFGGPQFELTVWSHDSTRNHGPGSSHFTISDRSILLNFSRGSRGNFAQWMLLVLQSGWLASSRHRGDLNVLVGDTWVPVFMASFQKMTAAASPVFRCILDSDLTAFCYLL